MSPLLTYMISGATASATLVLLVDYVRLRVEAHRTAKAALVAAALGGEVGTPVGCVEGACHAFRSSVCSDGRCRYHCRLNCQCKGNR